MVSLEKAHDYRDISPTLKLLEAALGPAAALREIRKAGRVAAAIGRWNHHGASVNFAETQTTRIVFNVTGGQELEWRISNRSIRARATAGSVAVVSPCDFSEIRIAGKASTVQVILSPAMIPAMSAQRHIWARPLARVGELQALATRALVALSSESNELAILSIVADIAQVLPSQQPAGPPVIRGGLSPGALRRVHLCLDRYLGHEPYKMPSVAELACAAGISQYHFIRAFRASEGQTPHAWIMARRVDFALRMILEERARIDEVADQAGFSSPSHFISAFRRRMGVTPRAVREAAYTD